MAIVDERAAHAALMTECVMQVVGPFITDIENDNYRKAKRALLDALYEADVRYSTALDRKLLDGWHKRLRRT